jgi:glycosyltransferase involved in cell wall biosynthesis
MKVLSISMDRKIFENGSAILERQKEYASKMEELHIVVFTTSQKLNVESRKIGNLFLYPTNSKSRWLYVRDAVKIGKKIVAQYNFKKDNSVITTQDPFETGLVGYRLKKIFNLPLQIQAHTDFLDSHFKSSILNRIRVKIANVTLPKADGIRVVNSVISDSIKEKLSTLKTKIDILPIFVDVQDLVNDRAESKINLPNFALSVLVVSRLEPEKRIDIALRAFKKVVTKFPKTGLIIVGEGGQMSTLKNLMRSLGLSENVVFQGWSDDVSSYYLKTDIFLLASDYEGYGMTLIEAGASGCSIVTTKVGIAKTDLFKNGENCFMCDVGDVECLAKRVVELLSDDTKRNLFKTRIQDSIKSTAIPKEEYVERYVALLQNLL